jgi:hypothetical protein
MANPVLVRPSVAAGLLDLKRKYLTVDTHMKLKGRQKSSIFDAQFLKLVRVYAIKLSSRLVALKAFYDSFAQSLFELGHRQVGLSEYPPGKRSSLAPDTRQQPAHRQGCAHAPQDHDQCYLAGVNVLDKNLVILNRLS